MSLEVRKSRMDTNTLLRQQINQQRRGSCILLRLEDYLALLVLTDVVDIHVEQIGAVERPAVGMLAFTSQAIEED
jgi:hypothetical protein